MNGYAGSGLSMAKTKKAPKPEKKKEVEPDSVADVQEEEKPRNYARGKGSAIPCQEASALYPIIQKAFENKSGQYSTIEENWNIYNTIADENAQYAGFTDVFNPIVRDAVNTRVRRRLMQLFPANEIHVGAITEDRTPFAHMALIEHYIRHTQLKEVVRQDLIAGDVTGQWCLLVGWETEEFSITKLVRKHPITTTDDDVEIENPSEDYEDVEEEEYIQEGPTVEPFPVNDFVIIPPTANRVSRKTKVAIKLRLSKEAVEELIEKGWLTAKDAESLLKKWDLHKDVRKERTEDAGVKVDGTDKYALIYMVWMNLTLDGEKKRPALVFFTGPNEIGGIIKNPNWSGRPDVICNAADKIGGSFYGRAKMESVKKLQYLANDTLAMGSDSTKYSLMPITMTDPLKNPNYASMTLGLGAVWATDPNSTKFQTFPQLWEGAVAFVEYLKKQIWESMDVNESQMGRAAGGRKNNQQMALMAQEAGIPITDDARRYEQVMLEPLMEYFLEMDLQHRHKEITIQQKGEIGVRASLEIIKPQQLSQRVYIQWLGTEYQMSMQRLQQQIALLNVARGIPPAQLNGRRLDVTPALEKAFSLLFGAEVAPRILIDERDLYTVDPEQENELMLNGFSVEVHPIDDDPKHMAIHQKAARESGDPGGNLRAHMARHMLAMFKKAQAASPMQQRGSPGVPGGAGPGVAGSPRQGALTAVPRPVQNPPGAVHADQQSSVEMPTRE
jgi:hypothetical protein